MMIQKKVSRAFGKDIFYIGQEKDGTNVWMEDFAWDCGWYWGGGYLETYAGNNSPENSRDIMSHTHFEGLKTTEEGKNVNLFDGFRARFWRTPLTEEEIWRLCDLMQSFYTVREAAKWFGKGSSHYTSMPEAVKRPGMAKECNRIIEEEIAPKVRELLSRKN